MRTLLLAIYIFIIPFSLARPQQATGRAEKTRILFVLDCSQSMAGLWGDDKKINIARKFLGRTIDSLGTYPDVEMALRVYGHQSVVPPQDCNDTRLEVPFAPNNGYAIKRKMANLSPKGTTPIANSLSRAASDFPPCEECRNVIILITDGIEACDGDPCEVARELQQKGIILKPFVIGIGLDPEFEKSFECLGNLYNASTEERFEEVLEIVITHALNETTLQVNLLDAYGNPSETNIPLTFYNKNSGNIKYNFVHTINNRGVPDTMRIDPLIDYRVKAHTLPPVWLDSLRLAPGKHNIAAIETPQGSLQVVQEKGYQYKSIEYIIRKSGSMETLWMMPLFEKVNLLKGKYDLEIPTIPITYLYGVEVKQSESTTVSIPQPGVITFLINNEGVCELFEERDNDLVRIKDIDTSSKSFALILLPGNYRVIYRPTHARQSYFTITKRFRVESGKSSSLRII
ncbi:MAG: VWA domain-containing protein [Bacteroidales bacterium]